MSGAATSIGRRGLATLAVGGLAALHGIAAARAAAAPLPVIIGMQTDADWLTIAARQFQLYEKAGLKPTYLKFTSGAPMMAAAQSGSINIAAPGLVPFTAGVGQGIPWVAIGIDNAGPKAEGFVVREGAGINTLADLKGKRIGYTRASTPQYVLLEVLRRNHIKPDEVTLLALSPVQEVAAMRAGNIDAVVVWEPWMHTLIADAHGKVIATEAELGFAVFGGVYAVRRDWLDSHREEAIRFLQAILLASRAVAQNPRPIIVQFAKDTGISEAWATDIFKEAPPVDPLRWTDPGTPLSMAKGGEMQRGLTAIATFLYEQKVIPKPVDMSHVIDTTVIAAAIQAQDGAGQPPQSDTLKEVRHE